MFKLIRSIVRLRLGALLVVIGAAISAASTVVTGLACARINSAAIHPCSLKYANSDPTLFPDVDTCTYHRSN